MRDKDRLRNRVEVVRNVRPPLKFLKKILTFFVEIVSLVHSDRGLEVTGVTAGVFFARGSDDKIITLAPL
jgi:hypothetical protein